MGRTDFDVTTGRLQNQDYFQSVYCNIAKDHRFYTICPYTQQNSLELTLILQPAQHIDVKLRPAGDMEKGYMSFYYY